MILRIFESEDMDLDLDTIGKMLFQADKQANFHPDSSWIFDSKDGDFKDYNKDENILPKRFKDLHVKWIGREAVIMWLVSNQVVFEIITFELLEEEVEAIGDLGRGVKTDQEQNLMN